MYGFLLKYTCIFFSLEEYNDVESKDDIDSDNTDLTDDDSDEATDTAVDTDDADSEESGKKIFRIYRVILLLPFRPILGKPRQSTFGFWVPSRGFRIPGTDLCQQKMDSIRYWNSEFLKEHSGA